MKQLTLNRILVAVAVAGFVFLFADSIIEHWDILKKEPMSLVPVITSVIGILITLVTFIAWKNRWIKILQTFLFVVLCVGAAGVYFHISDSDEDEKTEAVKEPKHEEKEKPLLAPLAFAGVAVVGLLGTARKWEAEVK